MPAPPCLDYYSFIVLKQECESSNSVLLCLIVLTILGPLYFHMTFKMSLSPSAEKPARILIGNTLNWFGDYCLLNNIKVFQSLLVYKDTIHFCVLIYPTTLLNSYVSSNCVSVNSLGFFICKIMSSPETYFTSCLQYRCLPFSLA